MSNTYIFKIGTHILPGADKSTMGLITEEPKNFGRHLVQLGIAKNIMFASDNNMMDFHNNQAYFKSTADTLHTITNNINDDDIVILWQGINIGHELDDSYSMPYKVVNELQARKSNARVYFIMTDVRAPLVNIDSVGCDIDVSQITLLTQASNVEALKHKLANNELRVRNAARNIEDNYNGSYYTEFKDVVHIPLQYMPLLTHATTKQAYSNHKAAVDYDLIFSAQSFAYLRDYRMSRLCHFMNNSTMQYKFRTAMFSKLDKTSLNALTTAFVNDSIANCKSVSIPELHMPVHFTKFKDIQANSVAQLCISEEEYIEVDLLPNRIFESIATGCIPLIDIDIYNSTNDELLRKFAEQLTVYVSDSIDIRAILSTMTAYKLRGFMSELKSAFNIRYDMIDKLNQSLTNTLYFK